MPRPKEFDEEKAVESAMHHFWRHGYEATSVRALADSMGIAGASLYNAFGDKHLLFERALLSYVGDTFARKPNDMAGLSAIKAFFEKIVAFSVKDPDRKGCLLVNSALEVAPRNDEVAKIISGVMREVEDFFRRHVAEGQAKGEITAAQAAPHLAQQLLATLLGIRVLARVRPERALFNGVLKATFAALEGPR
ncbi:MAG: TetR/AcrR family transcriptional regulator [Rhodospirillaceae bacterium]|nr:TetR/AcrR family transcriptional regulator [Rhodospirillaceae bacterium]